MEIIAVDGQNLVDIALRFYGSEKGLFQLLEDNPWMQGIDYSLKAGDRLKITPGAAQRQDIVAYFNERGVQINTGSELIAFAQFSDDFNEDFYI